MQASDITTSPITQSLLWLILFQSRTNTLYIDQSITQIMFFHGNPTTRFIPHNHILRKSHYESPDTPIPIIFFLDSK